MDDNKKMMSETGHQEDSGRWNLTDLHEDTSDSFSEEEAQELERWKEKRRKIAEKRRKRLFWNVVITMILTAAVFVGGILLAIGKFPAAEKMLKGTFASISAGWESMVSRLSPDEKVQKQEADTGTDKEASGDAESGSDVKNTDKEKSDADTEDTADGNSDTDEKDAADGNSDADEKASGTINPVWESVEIEETPYTKSSGLKLEKEDEEQKKRSRILKKAKKYATQYDYDNAIKVIRSYDNYDAYENMVSAIKQYKEIKANCVSWPIEKVTHIFYHTLIKDTDKAFDDDYKAGDYNQVMTTIDEFNKITESMYEKGYVMVSLYDLATVNEDGTMSEGEILLPEGKIPFVLSQDDVCYYHYMDGDGFASKLVVDEEGKIRNEYVEDDGSISVGDYDMVPLIDRFVEEHPDFSYKGAKGIIALTGYNGILGYRTDSSYKTRPDDLDDNKKQWLEEHPDFSLKKERAAAKKVAEAMKEEGWLFASHTWGHLNVSEIGLERLQADTAKFKENVDPLIGGTDIIIFAFGADLTQIEDYSGEKFEYLKSQGYNYYCNVDSSRYFVQLRDTYLRMGRRNLDGYRMYYNPELVEDLFDASKIFDKSRPTPVPPMG